MPQRSLPTPVSSTDMKAQEYPFLASLQMSFELPPPAIIPSNISCTPPQTPEKGYPMQPSETVKSRRRAATVAGSSKSDFALPPPPTRSRRIIQMKPREVAAAQPPAPNSKDSTVNKPGSDTVSASTNAASATPTATTSGAKKKQSAAGRKVARKTAHSLIERRRRSKMNEEFALLKSMIPACTGEMHKLAILQASIEYIKYLEDCVARLQARHQSVPSEPGNATKSLPTPSVREPFQSESAFSFSVRPEVPPDEDVEMSDSSGVPSPASSPALAATTSSHQPSASPGIPPQQQLRDRHDSISLAVASVDHQRHYSFSGSSVTASPAGFGAGGHLYGGNGNTHDTRTAPGPALTSPYLVSRNDLDHEATAALLMLNQHTQHDRRASTTNTEGPARAAAAATGTVRTGGE
ncbi:unnamed protein product [Sordaria macrospora k-hell]|uniref:WGS project CABT00000000 data, contig 2.12 n=1 Tax=Sordaria macrospora (strain ATCC MYA-333 / DSM 997 / K(L3346) / K-hell) TaxID=771870 RepID=F7VXI7_SORMK|nr:uncharacterized protein SMAC_02806 [Sordaria macrospora k-hell]CCC10229.1 unnamed protein product [Sordaria macrospora k-hell]